MSTFPSTALVPMKPAVCKGDIFTVPETCWVDIETGGTHHQNRGSGVINAFAKIEILGLAPEFGALCRVIDNVSGGGTSVTEGSEFFMDSSEMPTWNAKVESMIKTHARKKMVGEYLRRIA